MVYFSKRLPSGCSHCLIQYLSPQSDTFSYFSFGFLLKLRAHAFACHGACVYPLSYSWNPEHISEQLLSKLSFTRWKRFKNFAIICPLRETWTLEESESFTAHNIRYALLTFVLCFYFIHNKNQNYLNNPDKTIDIYFAEWCSFFNKKFFGWEVQILSFERYKICVVYWFIKKLLPHQKVAKKHS